MVMLRKAFTLAVTNCEVAQVSRKHLQQIIIVQVFSHCVGVLLGLHSLHLLCMGVCIYSCIYCNITGIILGKKILQFTTHSLLLDFFFFFSMFSVVMEEKLLYFLHLVRSTLVQSQQMQRISHLLKVISPGLGIVQQLVICNCQLGCVAKLWQWDYVSSCGAVRTIGFEVIHYEFLFSRLDFREVCSIRPKTGRVDQ